jgi:hypothetical protein
VKRERKISEETNVRIERVRRGDWCEKGEKIAGRQMWKERKAAAEQM